MTFYSWLRRQKKRRDLIGTLAGDYCTEPVCCPLDPVNAAEVMAHLEAHHRGYLPSVRKAVLLAWQEYHLTVWASKNAGAIEREADGSPKE